MRISMWEGIQTTEYHCEFQCNFRNMDQAASSFIRFYRSSNSALCRMIIFIEKRDAHMIQGGKIQGAGLKTILEKVK